MIDTKLIAKDWQDAFPQLTKFATDKFYKTIGPFVVGIELIKLPRTEEYRPHFVIYALWGNRMGDDLRAYLAAPILIQEFYNPKGFQLNIPYDKHRSYFEEAVVFLKKQVPLNLDVDVSLKEFCQLIDEYSKKPPRSAAPNSYLQAVLKEYELKAALYVGDSIRVDHVFSEIERKDWDVKHFLLSKIRLEDWRNRLYQTMLNKESFLSKIATNLNDDKIKRLKRSELVR